MDNRDNYNLEAEHIEDASPIFFYDDEEAGDEPLKSAEAPKPKKKNKGKIAYRIFVLVLLLAIIGGLIWVWNKCVEYQKSSAATLVAQACDELSEETGLELETVLIPKVNDEGDFEYVLKSEGKPVAKVILAKVKSGLLGLALFERKDVKSLLHFKVIIPDGYELIVGGEAVDISLASDYSLAETGKLRAYGFPVRGYKLADIDWIYDASEITVNKNGRILPLFPLADGSLFAVDFYSADSVPGIRARAAELSNKYALFMSNDYSFWALDPYIVYGSPLREVLYGMDMTWFGYHDYTQVNNLRMSDPVIVGDGYAMINVAFDYDVIRWDGTDRSPIELCLIMRLEDDGYWRLADLENNIEIELPMSEQAPWS
ncbi:MAG: hypothetical protein IJM49_04015 [Firmicutes bacterium]|nr:hypothetical protein [Bacillota bacterium]